MSLGGAAGHGNVALEVILEPTLLIRPNEMRVGRVSNVELHQEASVLETWLMEGHGSVQRNLHQLPLLV